MKDRTRDILEIVKRTWGYDSLRPLQEAAILAGLERRDSLVVLPTGGGKSLCYQVPPLLEGRTDVVVSPLISLMKDQVDALVQSGYPAAAIHSNLTADESRKVRRNAAEREYRLLFVSPERLVMSGFQDLLRQMDVRAFAVDEAHCISHWGHDFRPEYRQLRELKGRFAGASIHAFTATATERVREDIVEQLGLEDPSVLIGRFDRPNLVYRVRPKVNVHRQAMEAILRHPDGASIVYCLSRKETESLAGKLVAGGVKAAAYHAGMSKEDRSRTQEDFAAERLDVVVATVAFGMGIDRSNVRCVIHASLPKSVEHYQQETGRAGRDGLDAECMLLYSYSDVIRWEQLMTRSSEEAGQDEDILEAQLALLEEMTGYCGALRCRHLALTRYFGQEYDEENCGACDVCLDEIDAMPDSTVVAQKILSAVARTGQRYGLGYVVQVLRGSENELVLNRGHDRIPTHGALEEIPEKALTNLVYQLVHQGLVSRTPGDRPILRLNRESVAVLKGELEVKLTEPATPRAVQKSLLAKESWEGVDLGLFDRLRQLRRDMAESRNVPAYVIFGDRTIRELARVRPTSPLMMHRIHGIGAKKLEDLGPDFLAVIADYCAERDLETDVGTSK